ncbi:MAG: PTS sugar transporter subunit IIA [Fusobacteriaceae bacterium]
MEIIKIVDYIKEDLIDLNLKSKNKEEVLAELTNLIKKSENILDDKEINRALTEREKIGSTGIGKGVAIPHAKTESALKLTIAFGISKEKIEYSSLDGEKVNIFFVFASPLSDSQIYLKVLARISRLIREDEFRKKLYKCTTGKEVIQCISEEEGV